MGHRKEEFSTGWPVVLGASFGVGVGISSLLTYNSGLFASALEVSIGLTRTQFGMTYLLTTLAIAAAMPAVGWLVDRYGVRWPTVAGAAGLAISYLALSLLTRSVGAYVSLMVLLGVLGSASTSVSFTRAVTGWFDHARGLALGITQAGIGVSAALVPALVATTMHAFGWRAGYLLLGGLAALGIPTTLALLRTRVGGDPAPSALASEKAFQQVRRSGLFYLLFAAFSLTTLIFVGVVVHFVPLLRDLGVSTVVAARYAGLIGASVVFSRVIIGWLADMIHAPWLAAAACGLGGMGCLALASGESTYIPFAAIALGCVVGAEIDLLGYLTARYFGLGVYGRAYAWQYSGVIVASGASPAWIGWVADHTGGYHAALDACAALSVAAAGFFLAMPRHVRAHPNLDSQDPLPLA